MSANKIPAYMTEEEYVKQFHRESSMLSVRQKADRKARELINEIVNSGFKEEYVMSRAKQVKKILDEASYLCDEIWSKR